MSMPKIEVSDKAMAALRESPLLIQFRTHNNRVDYSIMNRPEPTLSGVSDLVLATALTDAGARFAFKRQPTVDLVDRETVVRADGRTVSYKDFVEVDFEAERLLSTRTRDLTLQVLSIVIGNVMGSVMQEQEKKPLN